MWGDGRCCFKSIRRNQNTKCSPLIVQILYHDVGIHLSFTYNRISHIQRLLIWSSAQISFWSLIRINCSLISFVLALIQSNSRFCTFRGEETPLDGRRVLKFRFLKRLQQLKFCSTKKCYITKNFILYLIWR